MYIFIKCFRGGSHRTRFCIPLHYFSKNEKVQISLYVLTQVINTLKVNDPLLCIQIHFVCFLGMEPTTLDLQMQRSTS